jgi:hypothetical protein
LQRRTFRVRRFIADRPADGSRYRFGWPPERHRAGLNLLGRALTSINRRASWQGYTLAPLRRFAPCGTLRGSPWPGRGALWCTVRQRRSAAGCANACVRHL